MYRISSSHQSSTWWCTQRLNIVVGQYDAIIGKSIKVGCRYLTWPMKSNIIPALAKKQKLKCKLLLQKDQQQLTQHRLTVSQWFMTNSQSEMCHMRITAEHWQSILSIYVHCNTHRHTQTHTTVLRPFFRDHPGEPVPEENFWTLWCKGRSTEADTLTIQLGATPSTPLDYWLELTMWLCHCWLGVRRASSL